MVLPDDLINQGFSLQDVSLDDLNAYMDIKKACDKKYADQYNGGWIEEIQTVINTDRFHRMLHAACFKKIRKDNRIAGFFTYDEKPDKINEVSIQLLAPARKKGMEAFCISHIMSRSKETDKPVFLAVFHSDPLKELYISLGFQTYGRSRTQELLSFNQGELEDINNYMNRIYCEPIDKTIISEP